MSQICSVGGGDDDKGHHHRGDHDIRVFGKGWDFGGNRNDFIPIIGKGSVIGGTGNDPFTIDGKGYIPVGGGNDSVDPFSSGTNNQHGSFGHDTITLGSGNDTVFQAGNASIQGEFGGASVVGGGLPFTHSRTDAAISGDVTMVGGASSNNFVAGPGSTSTQGGLAPETLIGGSGADTMTGGSSGAVFEFLSKDAGGHHVITNFVAGQDQLYLEGHSLSYLKAQNDINVSGTSTTISLDGGKTTIVLEGITHLKGSDITTHKP